ncbi:MAG: S8 family serine peptidase [Actinomycetota bacterium]|nr:S8 family serine peptidase [Actinomycetota bacterium]
MSPSVLIASRGLLLSLLLIAIFLCASASASAAQRSGRLLVMVERSAQSRATTGVLQRLGARTDGEQVPQIGLVTVRPVIGQTLAATAAILRRLPWVSSVTVERRHTPRFHPNDPALSQPETATGTKSGTLRQWWAARENLFAAWEITRGTGAKVAIIDSGIDGAHPEFAGKIAAALDNDPRPEYGPANFDEDGHGTHVASQACAAGNNAIGIVGSGLNCNLIVLKSDLLDASVTKSIVDATDLGADAINMSFGNSSGAPPPPALVAALNYAIERGAVLVAAADNNDGGQEQGDPANVLQPTSTGPDIAFNRGLTVTSADYSGLRSTFAGRGSQISLAAHGGYANSGPLGPNGVLGAWPANETLIDSGASPCNCRTTINGDNRYAYLKGTSIAAPQVAGIAALVAHLNPDLRSTEVVRLLKQTATRPAGSAWGPELGWGIVNAGAAVDAARAIDRRAPTSKARGPKRLRRKTTFTLRWSGKDVTRPGLVASGIRRYYVYRSTNGRKYKKIASTTKKRRRIRTRRGARYRFYTVAVDRKSNRERRPRRADVSLRVSRSR